MYEIYIGWIEIDNVRYEHEWRSRRRFSVPEGLIKIRGLKNTCGYTRPDTTNWSFWDGKNLKLPVSGQGNQESL